MWVWGVYVDDFLNRLAREVLQSRLDSNENTMKKAITDFEDRLARGKVAEPKDFGKTYLSRFFTYFPTYEKRETQSHTYCISGFDKRRQDSAFS